jgi:LysM domain
MTIAPELPSGSAVIVPFPRRYLRVLPGGRASAPTLAPPSTAWPSTARPSTARPGTSRPAAWRLGAGQQVGPGPAVETGPALGADRPSPVRPRPARPEPIRPRPRRAGQQLSRPARACPAADRVAGPAAAGAVRLTAFGRLVVGTLGVAAAAIVLALIAAPVAGLRQPARVVPASAPAEITVQPGETLWSIARQVAPGRDVREVVSELRRLNSLPSAELHAGQQLRLRAP